jgi:hypothetical protein
MTDDNYEKHNQDIQFSCEVRTKYYLLSWATISFSRRTQLWGATAGTVTCDHVRSVCAAVKGRTYRADKRGVCTVHEMKCIRTRAEAAWSRVLLDRGHKRSPLDPVLHQVNPVDTVAPCSIPLLILQSHLRLDLSSCFFHLDSPIEMFHIRFARLILCTPTSLLWPSPRLGETAAVVNLRNLQFVAVMCKWLNINSWKLLLWDDLSPFTDNRQKKDDSICAIYSTMRTCL